MAYIKKRDNKEISEKILRLKNNLDLIKNEKGKNSVQQTINILESFKDKSESEINSSITKDNIQKNRDLKWMINL